MLQGRCDTGKRWTMPAAPSFHPIGRGEEQPALGTTWDAGGCGTERTPSDPAGRRSSAASSTDPSDAGRLSGPADRTRKRAGSVMMPS
jgi:hypothetical protein